MTIEKSVLGIVPGLQATALVGHNIGAIKNFGTKKSKFGIKKMVGLGATNIVGVGLIGATASEINKLP